MPCEERAFISGGVILSFSTSFGLASTSSLTGGTGKGDLSRVFRSVSSVGKLCSSVKGGCLSRTGTQFCHAARMGGMSSLGRVGGKRARGFSALCGGLSGSGGLQTLGSTRVATRRRLASLGFGTVIADSTSCVVERRGVRTVGGFALTLSYLVFFFVKTPLNTVVQGKKLKFPIVVSMFIFVVFCVLSGANCQVSELKA